MLRVSAQDCFGHNWFGRDPVVVVVVVNQSRVGIFQCFLDELRSIRTFLEVLNLSWLFLKLNQFSSNYILLVV